MFKGAIPGDLPRLFVSDKTDGQIEFINSTVQALFNKKIKALWQKGYRYRKNYSALPGKPDIALTKYKIAVFCDSDFFHGKDWYTILRPRLLRGAHPEFWEKKILRNMERDKENNLALLNMGWTVIRFWGSEIQKSTDACVAVIEECIFEQMISESDDMGEVDSEDLDFE